VGGPGGFARHRPHRGRSVVRRSSNSPEGEFIREKDNTRGKHCKSEAVGRALGCGAREMRVITLLPITPHERASAMLRRRWGVILAGGDGSRLQTLTRLICGDDRPKQFCSLVGNDTLLEQTRKRAERSIPGEQILFLLTKSHRAFYLQEPGIRP
jgi:hypothetical protein